MEEFSYKQQEIHAQLIDVTQGETENRGERERCAEEHQYSKAKRREGRDNRPKQHMLEW